MKKNRDVDLIRLKEHLKALRLPTIQAECVKLARECLAEGVDHLDFLLKVCELELIERERKAAARRLKAAALPALKLISEFDFTAQPTINRLLVLDLMRCDYINKIENVLLIGSSGTGKTHIATSLAVEACSQGKRVRFYRVTELVTQLLEAREERQLSRIRGQLSKLDLLVLDELGYVPMGKAGAELLFDVMSRAYERMSLIVTTNLPFENWTEVLDNERLTGATLDRLTHRCHIVETGGESYRLKDARRSRRTREVNKPESVESKGPEQTPVNADHPGA
jgi:DNA replication protein DnaC